MKLKPSIPVIISVIVSPPIPVNVPPSVVAITIKVAASVPVSSVVITSAAGIWRRCQKQLFCFNNDGGAKYARVFVHLDIFKGGRLTLASKAKTREPVLGANAVSCL
jgi:hypothetical protein